MTGTGVPHGIGAVTADTTAVITADTTVVTMADIMAATMAVAAVIAVVTTIIRPIIEIPTDGLRLITVQAVVMPVIGLHGMSRHHPAVAAV